MVGVFQMFGISFLFWVVMGCLRFVFETIHTLRESTHSYSTLNLSIASFGGIGVSTSLFFLFFIGFGPFDTMIASEEAFLSFAVSILIIWLGCVTLGSYLATRIYVRNPYIVATVVGIGSICVGITLLLYAGISFAFTPQALAWEFVWIAVTMLASFLGGHMAYALNALERERTAAREARAKEARIAPHQVAVLIAAHNEELSIGETIEALLKVTERKHIYIASDGSSDNTVEIARKYKVNVEDIQPNVGKPRALQHVIQKNSLLGRYKAVFFLDAEIKPDKDLFRRSLPLFDDPDIVVVVNRALSTWTPHLLPRLDMLVTAYRIRLWRVLQFCIRYGQTWKYTNASPIIPGGSSIYRTSALKKIQMYVPGLIIEDFNMTFEIHHKKLGKIGFNPNAHIWDQEPTSVRDFIKQINRWYLGFFQTVRHHGIWPSWFFFSMVFFTLELMVGSFIFLLAPLFLIELLLSGQESLAVNIGLFGSNVTIWGLFVTFFVIDFLITIVVALIERKPLLLLYWITFFPLRYIEALVFMYTMFAGLFVKPTQDGKWKSPKRITSAAGKTA